MTLTTTPKLRKTRIVCISDTHNCTVKLPPGDVLIHAGDLTNKGSISELSRAVKWLEEADFEAKIVVAGNHDVTLDEDFYFHHGDHFHNKIKQNPADCINLLASSPSLTYLCHDSATIRLKSPTGPHTEFTVFGSPYSPRSGLWAFYYEAPASQDGIGADLTSLWELIPLETDIVVTHTPPRTHCDQPDGQQSAGCEALRQALWRVRPKLAVCGHIHDGRGAERVLWDLENKSTPYAEGAAMPWEDPGAGNNKMSLVDLTGKAGKTPALANDGSHPGRPSHQDDQQTASTPAPSGPYSEESSQQGSSVAAQKRGGGDGDDSLLGYGGDPASEDCDREALAGRQGRKETCVVNAAIMKGGYPHVGGKQFSKPIVVDLYLPVWED
ncbi:Metallo-dependent phosphatase [Trichoderma citrinoviride]|uniref:Metallo-dependent phosphatase n=1 Tax=Trichoderma citrinoviride TaxID=58853 RepID=A0A2T4B2E0_9HYPO|nr:Metallo-dependent phosphatase [Trichoderma citrinoviride]PTB63486.1 Metallo-dependent phosphatase [Trichoderma citrinoviride]